MLFIVFDIEVVFLYPLAVVLHGLGWFGFAEFGFFIAILVRRVRLHLAQGGTRVAVNRKRLADYGLHSRSA